MNIALVGMLGMAAMVEQELEAAIQVELSGEVKFCHN